jgi:hypothetical protein
MRVKTVIKRVVIGIAIFFAAIFIFGIILQITGYQPPEKPEQPQPLTEVPGEQADDAVEPQVRQTVADKPQQEVIPESQQQTARTVSDNILMNANLIEAPVINSANRRIGTRAYITLPQEILLEAVTLEDVTEFYQSFRDKGYNVVTIMCPEGTGLVFGGANGHAEFGKIDEYGRMAGPARWSIWYDERIGKFKELEF